MRVLALFGLAVMATAPLAQACNMSVEMRPSSVSGYAINGLACLDRPPGDYWFDTAMEARFVQLVNQERMSRGLDALAIRPALLDAARFHSLDMAINQYFAHEAPDGRTHDARISAFDRRLVAQSSAENLSTGGIECSDQLGLSVKCRAYMVEEFDNDPESIVQDLHKGLMDSPGHRANILSPDKTHLVMGVVRRPGSVHVTQLFVAQVSELDRSLPLRIRSGQSLSPKAVLAEWPTVRFVLEDDTAIVSLAEGVVPELDVADYRLVVEGEQRGEPFKEGNKLFFPITRIRYKGPALSVVSP